MSRLPDPDLAGLWQQKAAGCEAARAALIERFAGLVYLTQAKAVPVVPPAIDAEDLISEGLIALVRAVDRYDPARRVQFQSYAIVLIRAAMLEWLRAEDWVPRSVRSRQRAARRAGQEPLPEIEVISLETVFWNDSDAEHPLTHARTLIDPAPSPEEELLETERIEMLVAEVRHLPPREYEVLRDYYWRGRTKKATARDWGLSENWAQKVHLCAINRLRERLTTEALR